jgi:DmsE family decaheme c-type cytochrome
MKILIKIIMLCGLLVGSAYAENTPAPAAKPASAGKASDKTAADALDRDAVCTKCHDESENKPILSIYQTPHGNRADSRAPSCQSCHGESDAHVKGDAKQKVRPNPDFTFAEKSTTYPASPAEARSGQCLTCHESGLRTHWTGSQHQSQGIACNSCHTVHAAKDKVLAKPTQPDVCFTCHKSQRAETHLFSTHPILAGKTACSDCHNPHGSTGPKLLIKNSTNETCYTCHAEKRGPFLWEHSPVFDDCSNCHTPHGSNSSPLLKQRVPWLCQECHTADHANTVDSGANLIDGNATTVNGQQPAANINPRAQANARACLNCHTMIHGSNHPAGAKFNR